VQKFVNDRELLNIRPLTSDSGPRHKRCETCWSRLVDLLTKLRDVRTIDAHRMIAHIGIGGRNPTRNRPMSEGQFSAQASLDVSGAPENPCSR